MEKIEEQQLEKEWQQKLVRDLAEEFPEANIRQNSEYFIYDLQTASGTPMCIYTPKWEWILVVVGQGKEEILFRTEQFVRAELRWRKEFGDDYTVLDALRMEGLVCGEKKP